MAKKWYVIMVRRRGVPDLEYDRTQVHEWAGVQIVRAKRDHPGAEVKLEIRG